MGTAVRRRIARSSRDGRQEMPDDLGHCGAENSVAVSWSKPCSRCSHAYMRTRAEACASNTSFTLYAATTVRAHDTRAREALGPLHHAAGARSRAAVAVAPTPSLTPAVPTSPAQAARKRIRPPLASGDQFIRAAPADIGGRLARSLCADPTTLHLSAKTAGPLVPVISANSCQADQSTHPEPSLDRRSCLRPPSASIFVAPHQ